MSTTILVMVLIVVVLAFIGFSTVWITRRVEQAQGRDRCAFCGAALSNRGTPILR